MKIKFLKPFRLYNPIGDDMMMDEGAIENMEKEDYAQWLIDNGFAEKIENKSFCSSFTHGYDDFDCPYVQVGFYTYDRGNANLERDRFTEFLQAVNAVSKDEGFMLQTTRGGGVVDSEVATVVQEAGSLQVWKIDYAYRRAGAFYFDTVGHAYSSITKHRSDWQTIYDYKWGKE